MTLMWHHLNGRHIFWPVFRWYSMYPRSAGHRQLKVRNIINTLMPGQNGRHFPDDIFKCIFLNENVWISIKISLKFVPKGPINNIPALVQIMVWRRSGDKPLSEPMMVSLLTHICVTRLQLVKHIAVFKLRFEFIDRWIPLTKGH